MTESLILQLYVMLLCSCHGNVHIMRVACVWLQAKKCNELLTGVEREKDIVGEAERLDIKEKAPLILVELLLDSNILVQLKTYRNLFLRVCMPPHPRQTELCVGYRGETKSG